MKRRSFLSAILATACAPAIVRAESLMKCSGIVVPTTAQIMAINGAVLEIGAIFTIAGRFAINPATRKSTGILRRFVVTGCENGSILIA